MGSKKKKNRNGEAAAAAAQASPAASAPDDDAVRIETITPGDAKFPAKNGDFLTVHYVGSLQSDGSVFDSSRDKGKPFSFTLGTGDVVRGWDIALAKMTVGQRATLTIAASAGYGAKGCESATASGTGKIPPDADLVFDVELLDLNGRRSLARYLSTLDDWIHGKLDKYDSGHDEAACAAIDAKHGGRDAYEMYLRETAVTKYDAERTKKGAHTRTRAAPRALRMRARVDAHARSSHTWLASTVEFSSIWRVCGGACAQDREPRRSSR